MPAITPPIARVEMLIRRPPADVYRAFVDPSETTQFWFTRASAPLTPGAKVQWHWEMYDATGDVEVVALDPGERILIHWPTPVEWRFEPRDEGRATLLTIVASGFEGSDDELVAQALDNMGGFSLVVAGCKAWMEHGIRLNLVGDRAPDHHVAR